MLHRSRSFGRFLVAVAVAAALLGAGAARAQIAADVTIALRAPGGVVGDATPFEMGDMVGPGDGLKLAAGDGSNIGSFMLPLEEISFVGNSIRLRIAAGAVLNEGTPQQQLVTGYLGSGGDAARYEFTGLQIAGQTIVGLGLSDKDGFADAGFSGLISPVDPADFVSYGQGVLRVGLDGLVFADRGTGQSDAHVDLRIDLLTRPVPEPSTALLLALGALGLGVWRRHATLRTD